MAEMLKQIEEEEKAQIVRLGDASIASPFTSKLSTTQCGEESLLVGQKQWHSFGIRVSSLVRWIRFAVFVHSHVIFIKWHLWVQITSRDVHQNALVPGGDDKTH